MTEAPTHPSLADERPRPGTWRDERTALVRALAGAYLFGIPLLFTMEMWWIGEHLDAARMLALLGGGLLVNVALAHAAGFRRERSTLRVAIAQGIESLAIGIVAATAMLAVLGQFAAVPVGVAAGMVAVQCVPLSLGASVANLVFQDGDRSMPTSRDDDEDTSGGASTHSPLLADILGTVAGAVFIGFSIAPTEEIPMLAAGLDTTRLLVLLAATLVVGYLIVFASGFDPTHREGRHEGPFQGPVSETVLSYVLAVVVSTALLVAFGQIHLGDPLMATIAKVMVLAVPASVGGAAGRVVV